MRPSRISMPSLAPARRTLRRCLVCGFAEVRTDEVVDRGVVLLAECGRCAHRWTERQPLRVVAALPEEADAA